MELEQPMPILNLVKKNGLVLNGNPLRLGLWVKGDGQGSWLRGIVKDKNGKEHYIDFAKSLDFTDWQYVEANIPDNIAYPITLERIYVVEVNNNKKNILVKYYWTG